MKGNEKYVCKYKFVIKIEQIQGRRKIGED